MKTLGCWLIAALSLAGCSSGSNHDRGGTGSGGTQSESGSGGLGAGNPGGGGPSQGGSSSNGGSNSNGGTGTTSGGSGATTGGTPGSSGSVGYSLNCPAPSTGRPVLRLFTRFEFENTINDVFPAIKGQWTNSLPANTVSGAGFDNDSANSPGNQFVSGLLESAESVGALVAGSALANLLPCSSAAADRACAGTFVEVDHAVDAREVEGAVVGERRHSDHIDAAHLLGQYGHRSLSVDNGRVLAAVLSVPLETGASDRRRVVGAQPKAWSPALRMPTRSSCQVSLDRSCPTSVMSRRSARTCWLCVSRAFSVSWITVANLSWSPE